MEKEVRSTGKTFFRRFARRFSYLLTIQLDTEEQHQTAERLRSKMDAMKELHGGEARKHINKLKQATRNKIGNLGKQARKDNFPKPR